MSLRIGEVAELTGTTPRTIRYYEELACWRPSGAASPALTASTTRPTSSASRRCCACAACSACRWRS